MKELLTGNQIIVKAALQAGADAFFGYPITPATEILEEWAKLASCDKEYKDKLISLQMEDEMAAGFALIGAVLAGKKAFTATAGPGNVLMQDAFSMAEAMRLPTVAFIMQRGGPSTGTVIYSQSETILTCFGGNGEGLRIVYSPSSLEELYELAARAFDAAWKYRFPTFVLSDGYQAKMRGNAILANYCHQKDIPEISSYLLNGMNNDLKSIAPEGSFLQTESGAKIYTSLRNCYNTEEELNAAVESSKKEFENARDKIEDAEIVNENAETLIIAHGIAGAAAKEAINNCGGSEFGLFRPISLSPFPKKELNIIIKNKSRIAVLESSGGQLGILAKNALSGLSLDIEEICRPGKGFYPEEIISLLKSKKQKYEISQKKRSA